MTEEDYKKIHFHLREFNKLLCAIGDMAFSFILFFVISAMALVFVAKSCELVCEIVTKAV